MSEFPATIGLGSLDGTTGVRIGGAAANDRSGHSVSSAGDVNGDGVDDVIVGAYLADPGGRSTAGSSYVVFGRPGDGFGPTFDLAGLTAVRGFRIDGASASDASGFSVSSAGDVNGDGVDDIIIGAPGADPGGKSGAGSSYVVFGREGGGFGASIQLGDLDGANGFRLDGAAAGDASGRSVSSAGDVNGDGVDDLIVGARAADPSGRGDAGSSYVVFGREGGFDAAIDLSSLGATDGFRIDGASSGVASGYSVSSAGDVNGDGVDDLIVGAPFSNPGGRVVAGSSYVVFGREGGGFGASFDLAGIDGSNGFRLDGAEYDRSGHTVSSAGDVNGDGVDDIIVGALDAARGDGVVAGASYVVFGREGGGFGRTFNLASLDGANGFRIDGASAGDRSGVSVSSAGDVNGDGFDDVIVGAYFADPGGRSYAGSSYVVFGKAGGFGATINLSSLNGANGFRLDGVEGEVGSDIGDRSGRSVSSAGDVNGDGFDDLIVGANTADPGGRTSAGASYVVFGRAPDAAVTRTGTDAANTISGGAFGDNLIGLGDDDTLKGNAGADTLLGDGGADLLEGGAGADALYGGVDTDTAVYTKSTAGVDVDLSLGSSAQSGGEAAGDTLFSVENLVGSAFADVLTGDADRNVIEGGAGADRINGVGTGDVASYARSSVGVTVDLTLFTQVSAGDADDDVLQNIANLRGSAFDDSLTGDALANVLNGGGGEDTLTGGAGDDRYKVDNVGDSVVEAARGGVRDTVLATVDHTLEDFVERIKVSGAITGLSLTGNELDNYLIGDSGDETLTGGAGDDRYYVTSGDVVVEAADGGVDRVFASEDYTLSGNIEQLRAAAGSVGLRLTGDVGENLIVGGAGADTLTGAGGRDVLAGGAGDDAFRFVALSDSAPGRADVIRDFVSGADMIDLSGLDAVTGGADGPFDFVGTDAFSRVAGELRYEFVGANTRIEADVDGDGKADFRCVVGGVVAMSATDFLL